MGPGRKNVHVALTSSSDRVALWPCSCRLRSRSRPWISCRNRRSRWPWSRWRCMRTHTKSQPCSPTSGTSRWKRRDPAPGSTAHSTTRSPHSGSVVQHAGPQGIARRGGGDARRLVRNPGRRVLRRGLALQGRRRPRQRGTWLHLVPGVRHAQALVSSCLRHWRPRFVSDGQVPIGNRPIPGALRACVGAEPDYAPMASRQRRWCLHGDLLQVRSGIKSDLDVPSHN